MIATLVSLGLGTLSFLYRSGAPAVGAAGAAAVLGQTQLGYNGKEGILTTRYVEGGAMMSDDVQHAGKDIALLAKRFPELGRFVGKRLDMTQTEGKFLEALTKVLLQSISNFDKLVLFVRDESKPLLDRKAAKDQLEPAFRDLEDRLKPIVLYLGNFPTARITR